MSMRLASVRTALLCVAASAAAAATPGAGLEYAARHAGIRAHSCSGVVTAALPEGLQRRILDPREPLEDMALDPAWIALWHPGSPVRASSGEAQLCRYQLENASLRHVVVRVVFIGDSVTELWKAADPEFFSEGLIDRGVTGELTAQMLVRFSQDVIALKPAAVHILAGTSDMMRDSGPATVQSIRNNIASMVERAVAHDVRVVIGAVPPAGVPPWQAAGTDLFQRVVELDDALMRFAHERGVVYADYHRVLADERDAMKQTYSNDGVHPNRDGYSAMEPLARRAIAAALDTRAPGSQPFAGSSRDRSP